MSELEIINKDVKDKGNVRNDNVCLFCERPLETDEVYFCSVECEKGNYARLNAMESVRHQEVVLPKLTDKICSVIRESVKHNNTTTGLCDRCGQLSTNLKLDRIAYREKSENVVINETDEEVVFEDKTMSRIDTGFFCEDCLKNSTFTVETTMDEFIQDKRNDVANGYMMFENFDFE